MDAEVFYGSGDVYGDVLYVVSGSRDVFWVNQKSISTVQTFLQEEPSAK